MKARTTTGAALTWIGVKIAAIKLITGAAGIFWPIMLCLSLTLAVYFSTLLLTYKENGPCQ